MTQESLSQLLKKLSERELDAKGCVELYKDYIASNGSKPSTIDFADLIKMLDENWSELKNEVKSSKPDALVLFLLKIGVLFEAAPDEVQKSFQLGQKSREISEKMYRLAIQRAVLQGIYTHAVIASQSDSFWHQLVRHLLDDSNS